MRNSIRFAVVSLMFLSVTAGAGDKSSADHPLRVSMFSGAAEYKSDQTLSEFKRFLEQRYDAQCTLNVATNDRDLPGVEQLDTCDVILVFTRRLNVPPEQLARIKKYMESGKGVVGVRTASHAFQTWLEFDHEVLGGDYKGHATDKPARVSINPAAKDHPVLARVEPFTTSGKLYTNARPASDITILLTATTEDDTQPVAWVRTLPEHRDQRVFYTSLGVPADFRDENFRRMLANAVLWAGAKTNLNAPAR